MRSELTGRVTYIGHQSWYLEWGGARILVDPVLTRSFGNSDRMRFEIFPGRVVHTADMPPPHAVVVTNEHLDHFHLPSLELLSPDIPVYVPELTPVPCVEALEARGRRVVLLPNGVEAKVGDARVQFLPGSLASPMWESRVSAFHVRSSQPGDGGVLVQSDVAIDMTDPAVGGCRPDVLISTHNGQIPPDGATGAFDNLLPLERRSPTTGIELLHEVLESTASCFPSARYVLLSGGGYTQVPPKHGRFLWADFVELERLVAPLSLGASLLGTEPGDTIAFAPTGCERGRTPWISPDDSRSEADPAGEHVSAGTDGAVDNELPPLFPEPPSGADLRLLEAELAALAPLMIISPLGREMVNANQYLGKEVGALRFALHLRNVAPGRSMTLALDLNRARFVPLDGPLRQVVLNVPFGVDVNARDLVEVFEGRLHIWELATSRMRQWYVTDRFTSPVAFLYSCLGEQVRPDLARRLYERREVGVR